MLMLAVAALGLPAALMLSDEMRSSGSNEKIYVDKNGDGVSDINDGPTFNMILLSRFNATIMIVGYLLYLLFQLKSHKDEFDDLQEEEDEEENQHEINQEGRVQRHHIMNTKKKTRKNKFCRRLFNACRGGGWKLDDDEGELYQSLAAATSTLEMEMSPRVRQNNILSVSQSIPANVGKQLKVIGEQDFNIPQCREISDVEESRNEGDILIGEADVTVHKSNASGRRRSGQLIKRGEIGDSSLNLLEQTPVRRSNKSHCSDGDEEDDGPFIVSMNMATIGENGEESKSFHC